MNNDINKVMSTGLDSENRSVFDSFDDAKIWKLFKSGDESAFIFIYRKYFKQLYNYGYQFTRSENLIEDTIQDVFIELRDRGAHLSDTNDIQPYLYTAFRRKIIRLRDREKKVFNDLPETTFELDFSIEDTMIADQTKDELTTCVKDAISKLTEQQREIIYCYFYKGFSYEEIKEIVGYENVKSVRNKMYKILNSLKEGFPTLTIMILAKLFTSHYPAYNV